MQTSLPFPTITFEEQQRRAIEHVQGPMLVVAGAGTGKTAVLVERIARLIENGHAKPSEILAVTYTLNSASEIRDRVRSRLLGTDTSGLQACTFHAYGYGLLQRQGKAFSLLDDKDLWVFLRQRLAELPLGYYQKAAKPAAFLNALTEFFSRCFDELVDVDDYEQYVQRLEQGHRPLPRVLESKKMAAMSDAETLARAREIAAVFRKTEELLAERNLGTFGHQILRAVQLLKSDPKALAEEQRHTRFLLIDEFQDVNYGQIELASILAGAPRNLFVVGDPDQAIYRFRGASSAAFVEFSHRFPDTQAVVLGLNQRSFSPILSCAFAGIAPNSSVHCQLGNGKNFEREPLRSAREQRAKEQGLPLKPPPVQLVLCASNEQEASDIATRIAQLRKIPHENNGSPAVPRFAVLVRMHAHRTEVVRELAERGIRFSIKGVKAQDTPEVRDLLACLRVTQWPKDAESLFRVAALPCFSVDATALREALYAAGRSPVLALLLPKLPGGQAVLTKVESVRAQAVKLGMKVEKTVPLVIREFGLDASCAPIRTLNAFLKAWLRKPLAGGQTLEEFLTYLEYFTEANGAVEVIRDDQKDDPESVQIMTVHSAKGLEFDHVFVMRLGQGSFPVNYRESLFEFPPGLRKSLVTTTEEKRVSEEEERRLFYVALTRARDMLTLLARPGRGKKDPRPGAFVRNLLDNPAVQAHLQQRPPAPYTPTIHASTSTGVGEWLYRTPSSRATELSLSASGIQAYSTCPLQYKLKRDWNLPGRVTANLQYGSIMHTVLKDYYDALQAGARRKLEEVLARFEAELENTHFEEAHQRNLYQRQGILQLTQFVEAREREAAPEILSTERTFDLTLGPVKLRGRIDRMDKLGEGRVAIVDYKTGRPQQPDDARKSLQLSIYALAAQRVWQLTPERLILHNLEDDSQVSATRDQGALKKAEEEILDVAHRIRAGEFAATPGRHCNWCDYRQLCPETEERLYRIEALQDA